MPSLHRTLFRTAEPERVVRVPGLRAVRKTLADLADELLAGRLDRFAGPPVDLVRRAFDHDTAGARALVGAPPPTHAETAAMRAWLRLCAQGLGARGGLEFETTEGQSHVVPERGHFAVRISTATGFAPAVSVASAGASLRDWSVSSGMMWAETGVLWHELRHALDRTDHRTEIGRAHV